MSGSLWMALLGSIFHYPGYSKISIKTPVNLQLRDGIDLCPPIELLNYTFAFFRIIPVESKLTCETLLCEIGSTGVTFGSSAPGFLFFLIRPMFIV
jgi:hypothetical protein